MKKLFAVIAVVLACATLSAQTLFTETFSTKRGDTYIDKVQLDNPAWPYASQWFEGYTGTKGAVEGNQYDNDYEKVESYGVSVRNQKLNGSDDYSVGVYFSNTKEEAKDYVKFTGALPEIPVGVEYFLFFDVCSTETDGGDLSTMVVKVNDAAVEVPATTLDDKFVTSEVKIALPAGQIESLYFAFNNVPSQKFIPKFWIAAAGESGVENVVLGEKAQKVMVDGQVYVIRNNKLFNLQGVQVR